MDAAASKGPSTMGRAPHLSATPTQPALSEVQGWPLLHFSPDLNKMSTTKMSLPGATTPPLPVSSMTLCPARSSWWAKLNQADGNIVICCLGNAPSPSCPGGQVGLYRKPQSQSTF